MKKLFFSLMALLAFVSLASAQQFALGIKAGGNFNKISGQSFKNGYKFGVHAGAFLELDFTKTIGIQPELLFNQSNTTTKDNVTGSDFVNASKDAKLNYLSVPLLLRVNVNKLLTLQAGPQFSILMNKDSSIANNTKQAFKSGDFAAALGAQLNLGSLRIMARYNIGLSNINDINSQEKWKTQQIQLGIGLKIL